MPEVSAYEMRRLVTIWDNHLLLKHLCGPGDSVYEFQNSKTLLDAALALETGRLPMPSPPRSTASESSDGDIEERKVQNLVKKEVPRKAADDASIRNAEVLNVAELRESGGETKRTLRTRKTIVVISKQSNNSSEEEDNAAADTDEDFVEGKTTDTSSVESEENESEEDDEDEYEDSDSDSEDSDEKSSGKIIVSKGSIETTVPVVHENPDSQFRGCQVKPSLSTDFAKEVGAAVSKRRQEVTVTMDVSENKEREKEGFETWSTGKKSRRKPTSTKKVVLEENVNKSEVTAINIQGRQPGQADFSPKSSGLAGKVVGGKMKSHTVRSQEGRAEETVTITEKEYRLLLSLKRKSTATETRNLDDEMNRSAERGDGSVFPVEVIPLVVDISQRPKKTVSPSTVYWEEEEEDARRRKREKGKNKMKSGALSVDDGRHEEGIQENKKRRKAQSAKAEEDEASDSDFADLPKRRVRTGDIAEFALAHRRQYEPNRGGEENAASHVPFRAEQRRTEWKSGKGMQAIQSRGEGVAVRNARHDGRLLNHGKRNESGPPEDNALKKKKVFAFEKNGEDNGMQLLALQGSAEVVSLSDADADFQGLSRPNSRSNDELLKSVSVEAQARASRKRKKANIDLVVRKKESAGEKPFYIMVNALGNPYGDGLTAWRAEVNRLSRGLDPSIHDVRQQPHQKIEVLKKRLMDKFEYSGVISDKFLLPLIGQRVSARRNELMNLIRSGKSRPSGMDNLVWERLESISKSPNFQKKSAAMRYANACRHSLGRTGPGGEIRVRHSLKQALRRSPDPEEVQAEMTRDKGYGGKKRKTKKMSVRVKVATKNAESGEEGVDRTEGKLEDGLAKNLGEGALNAGQSSRGEGVKETSTEQVDLMKRLLVEIEELKAKVESGVPHSSTMNVQAAVNSMTVTPPASSSRGVNEKADGIEDTPTSLSKTKPTFSLTNRGT